MGSCPGVLPDGILLTSKVPTAVRMHPSFEFRHFPLYVFIPPPGQVAFCPVEPGKLASQDVGLPLFFGLVLDRQFACDVGVPLCIQPPPQVANCPPQGEKGGYLGHWGSYQQGGFMPSRGSTRRTNSSLFKDFVWTHAPAAGPHLTGDPALRGVCGQHWGGVHGVPTPDDAVPVCVCQNGRQGHAGQTLPHHR